VPARDAQASALGVALEAVATIVRHCDGRAILQIEMPPIGSDMQDRVGAWVLCARICSYNVRSGHLNETQLRVQVLCARVRRPWLPLPI
jgi:hypothetical protein